MDIISTVSLESNSQIKINFDGGDLTLLFTGRLDLKKPVV